MVYYILLTMHIISCMVLIAVILLQAGRGGGLAETFGGKATQTIFGTQTTTFLARATTICAILYLVTCLSLAILSSHQRKSLMDTRKAGVMYEGQREADREEKEPAGTVEETPEAFEEPVGVVGEPTGAVEKSTETGE